MKAVLSEKDSLLVLITDSVPSVHSSSKIQTLTILKEMGDENKTIKAAEKEVRQPTSISEEWVVNQVLTDDRPDTIGMHLRHWMVEN